MSIQQHLRGRQTPRYGPRVFEDAAHCPALAAVAVSGRLPSARIYTPPLAPMPPAWLAAKRLLAMAHGRPTTPLARLVAEDRDLRRQSAAVRRYAMTAVEHALEALDELGTASPKPATDWYETQAGSAELHAGGALVYRDDSNGQWIIIRLRVGSARPISDATSCWALTAGYVVVQNEPTAKHILVAEVGGADGTVTVLGRWPRHDLVSQFDTRCSPALQDMSNAWREQAGPHCASCQFVGTCDSAPRISGLLTAVRRAPHVTRLSASDIRTYSQCPARYRLQCIDGLPPIHIEATAAQQLGRTVHEWLAARHADGTRCTNDDLAPVHDTTIAALLKPHLDVCPFFEENIGANHLQVEPSIVALDEGSNLLLVARPDLTIRIDDRTRWRETKTTATTGPIDPEQLVTSDITAALYLLLLASGVDGLPDALEWEVLAPTGAELAILDPTAPSLVAAAQTTISANAADILADEVYAARPGNVCHNCPVAKWCPDSVV